MRCEVCGRKIHGKPHKVIIEGAKLTVCNDCSKHGKLTWEEEPKPSLSKAKAKTTPLPLKSHSKASQEVAPTEATVELVEDFDVRIRHAREKLGISHEELGGRISEKVSLLKKIETGKMTPDNKLAAKLERALKTKLIVPASEEKAKISPTNIVRKTSGELTLGDIIRLNKKSGKAAEDES